MMSENLEALEEEGGDTAVQDEGNSVSEDSVSNPDAPEPPENDEDPIVGNDMESEGITNEEAGLE